MTQKSLSHNRRKFLSTVGKGTAATLTTSLIKEQSFPATKSIAAADKTGLTGQQRANEAYQIRLRAALTERLLPLRPHQTNGDDTTYPNKIASYTKGLPHDNLGEVDQRAYQALVKAVTTGNPTDFEAIPMGGARKLVNPQGSLAFDLQGPDSHRLSVPPAPAFASAEAAGEMVELYWMSLLRDVPLTAYANHPLANQAAVELSTLSHFKGPKDGSNVTPQTLFRANIPGIFNGPFVSQFLWKDVTFGAYTYKQLMRTAAPGIEYLTSYDNWLASQRGVAPGSQQLDPTLRYVRNGRDLARWVQVDVLFQAYFNAVLILQGMRAPVDANNRLVVALESMN